MAVLRTFGWSVTVTVLALAAALLAWGPTGLVAVAVLGVLEVSLSFDNAVVNATVLRRMDAFWQRLFLTVGILIAVFGMRLVFPLLVVSATTRLSPAAVLDLAINNPGSYAEHLDHAHPAIAAFGGMFLLMIALDFLLAEREIHWLPPLERALARAGRLDRLPVLLALGALVTAAVTLAGTDLSTVLVSGTLGLIAYLAVGGLSQYFQAPAEEDEPGRTGPSRRPVAVGKAAFFLFLYLEVLDASFSFDGVVGAFAISQNIFQIALGLGIGAMFIRSLTVHLVRRGTLDDYVYLEHGAHYAIGALAVILLVTIRYDVPQTVTASIGVAFIGTSFLSSLARNRRRATPEAAVAHGEEGDGGHGQPHPGPVDLESEGSGRA
ncbi:DUF475 domain-containing protein [Streptomyces sp. SAI-090]|uniref:DUF475 domain-containing protein n=1 Tax=Streptomyces sp. SAI-090 TaxID=2940545 RepID=UPI0024771026|nr:DUF475 domain-containing protein [Streptomyces sp. SAI-090]MDH6522302.1 hypothetical protein [Streptomyces sp. SAI-090]